MSATIASMFHVRCIHPDQGRIEANSFELQPTNSQGEAVCDLFRRYLADRPATFRDKLPFLRKGDIELDWSAAKGGVALASLFSSGEPAAISVPLTGLDPEADRIMWKCSARMFSMCSSEGSSAKRWTSSETSADPGFFFRRTPNGRLLCSFCLPR